MIQLRALYSALGRAFAILCLLFIAPWLAIRDVRMEECRSLTVSCPTATSMSFLTSPCRLTHIGQTLEQLLPTKQTLAALLTDKAKISSGRPYGLASIYLNLFHPPTTISSSDFSLTQPRSKAVNRRPRPCTQQHGSEQHRHVAVNRQWRCRLIPSRPYDCYRRLLPAPLPWFS